LHLVLSVNLSLLCVHVLTFSALQLSQPQLHQLLWSSCRPSMQQLLQPLQVQLQGLPNTLASISANKQQLNNVKAIEQQQQQQLLGYLPAALERVQQQLQLLAGGGSSSGGTALLLQLLQLAVVAIPASGPSSETAAAAAAAGGGVAAAAAAAKSSSSYEFTWVLQDQQQQQQHQAGSIAGSPRAAQLLQQQQHQFLVFQAAGTAQVLHVLPLQLAVSVLQLLQGLALHDASCLGLLAAGLGASHVPGSYQQLYLRRNSCWQSSSSNRYGGASGRASGALSSSMPSTAAAAAAAGASAGSSAAAAEAAADKLAPGLLRFDRFSSSSSRAAAGSAAVCWGPAESAVQAALSASSLPCAGNSESLHSSAVAAAAHGKEQQQANDAAAAAPGSSLHRQKHSTLLCLLADAAACHPSLLLQVGCLLAVLAERLPVQLRQLLLVPPISDIVLLQLLHGEGYAVRCQAAAVLQALLVCPAVAAALTAAALPEPTDEAAAAVAAGGDAVMTDADAPAAAAPLQPCNRGLGTRSTGKSSTAAKATASSKPTDAAEQQRQGSSSSHAAAAARAAPRIANQSVYDILFGLLDCLSVSLSEAPAEPNFSSNSSSSSGVSGLSRWGRLELQRRSCGIVAQLLHNRQVALLQLLLDGAFTAGA
jgi:hypothetical protein